MLDTILLQEPFTCTSWINGKYDNGEINTSLSYVAVNEPEFYVQGDEADEIIKEIHKLWFDMDMSPEEAFNLWVSIYL